MDARVRLQGERRERELGFCGVVEAVPEGLARQSARRPPRPAHHPCRRRPRTAANGRAGSPRWPGAGARCRFPRTAQPRAASQSTSNANSLSPMRTRSPGCKGPGRLEQLLVEIGAVGGVEILDDHYVALLVDARVPRGGERVLQPDLGSIAAAQHDVPVEVVDHPGVVAGGALDHQPGSSMGDVGAAQRGGRVQAGGVRRDPRTV